MTVIAAILACAIVLTVVAFLRHIAALEAAWTAERRELLTRVQHPELIPAPASEPAVVPDSEPDELSLVGTIEYED